MRNGWKESLPLVAAYPITGCGLGAYESCFLAYKKVAPGYTVDFAHNDYLHVMAEFGLPAFALLLTLTALARDLQCACTLALTKNARRGQVKEADQGMYRGPFGN